MLFEPELGFYLGSRQLGKENRVIKSITLLADFLYFIWDLELKFWEFPHICVVLNRF